MNRELPYVAYPKSPPPDPAGAPPKRDPPSGGFDPKSPPLDAAGALKSEPGAAGVVVAPNSPPLGFFSTSAGLEAPKSPNFYAESELGTVEPKRLPDFFSGSAAGLIVFRLPNSEPPDACLVTGAPNRLPDSTGFYSTFAGSGSVFPAKVPPPIGLNLGSTFDAGAPNKGFAGAAEPKSPPEDGFLLRSTPPN